MATATMIAKTSAESPGSPVEVDPRVAAFCSKPLPELFHAFAYANDIWRRDPFDVESIHPGARETFQRIVGRVRETSGLPTGRILLLLGDAGAGKTHLMRAFRNQVHARSSGYCGYLQMTAFTGQYGRYVLNNLIDSLDKPYDESRSETTGLMRLSNALAESSRDVPRDWLDRLREGGLDQSSLDQRVAEMADRIILDDRFNTIDVYLIQVLLYLQCNDPRIKARVLKYLRCEDLTEHDRRLLGGIVPCTYPDAPHRIIERLGQLMWAVERVPLILCVDQLEDVFDLDDSAVKFRRAMATLCDIVSRLRSAIVVIACLEDYYAKLKELLTKPIKDRVENDPPPLGLATPCDREQVEQLIAQRLKYLYESMNIPFQPDQPVFPLPEAMIGKLVGLRARDVLNEVYLYRERCIAKGKMAEAPFDGPLPPPSPDIEGKITEIEQAWNEFHSTWATVVPSDEAELAGTLSEAIASCSAELETGNAFEAERDGRFVPVERHAADNSVGGMLVGICNKGPQGGALGRQIEEVEQRAGEHTPVIVRSTAFPASPKAAVSLQLGKLIARGGRRVVVEDSDWRTMMALAVFRSGRGIDADPAFVAWLKRSRPLTGLTSLRAILDLDRRAEPGPKIAPKPAQPPAPEEPTTGKAPTSIATTVKDPEPIRRLPRADRIVIGTTSDRRVEAVAIDPAELTRHAAFLGAPGSGKTTAALGVVEQLLIQGIPAILIDRKGDLCAYARPDLGLRRARRRASHAG